MLACQTVGDTGDTTPSRSTSSTTSYAGAPAIHGRVVSDRPSEIIRAGIVVAEGWVVAGISPVHGPVSKTTFTKLYEIDTEAAFAIPASDNATANKIVVDIIWTSEHMPKTSVNVRPGRQWPSNGTFILEYVGDSSTRWASAIFEGCSRARASFTDSGARKIQQRFIQREIAAFRTRYPDATEPLERWCR